MDTWFNHGPDVTIVNRGCLQWPFSMNKQAASLQVCYSLLHTGNGGKNDDVGPYNGLFVHLMAKNVKYNFQYTW